MRNKILAVVVTYNGMKWMDRCLGSLSMSKLPVDVIVIDNGSTDGTPGYIAEYFPEVKLVATGENHGFGRANNVGFRYAMKHGYEYIYLLNQDAWIFPDTFGFLVDAMEDDKSLGVLSPMQLTATEQKLDPRFEKWCPRIAWDDFRKKGSRSSKVYGVKFVMAAHWMISRECLEDVGGFSPAFTHYGEDDNFLHRARYKGYKVGVHSGARAVHDRELRPMSKESSMRLKCVASVVKISNPLEKLWFRLLFQPVELLAISIRYRSMYVFRNIFTLIRSYRKLIAIRRDSLDDMAFLK